MQPHAIDMDKLDRRAGRIQDPIQRLRFLQRAALGEEQSWRRVTRYWRSAVVSLLVLAFQLQLISDARPPERPPVVEPLSAAGPVVSEPAAPHVWLVDRSGELDLYSNGLRIEKRFLTSTRARSYFVYARDLNEQLVPDVRTEPAGIVYHTTESHLAPFEAEQNGALQRIGQALIEYVRKNQSYHFVIDRFGRVYRVVAEADVANHAGHSIWADERGVYLNLNHSFLGVAFETQSGPPDAGPQISPAQLLAGRVLTEMLRSKYRIPAANCVTHAQVSVNPDNMRIGYHTDWAGNFPFQNVGLTDNYARPVPSMYVFGFGYDSTFLKSTGARAWDGLRYAEDQLRRDAAAQGLTLTQHRRQLQRKYRDMVGALHSQSASKDRSNETD